MIRHGISEYNDYTGYTLVNGALAIAKSKVTLDLSKEKLSSDKLRNDIHSLEKLQHDRDVDKNTISFINNVILLLRDYVEFTAIDEDNDWNDESNNINAAIYLSSDVYYYLEGDISRLRNVIFGYTEPDTTTHLHLNLANEGEDSVIITIQNHVKYIDDVKE